MAGDRMPFNELLDHGAKFVRWHFKRAKAAGVNPGGETYWPDWDYFVDKRGHLYSWVELKAIGAYGAAACGITGRVPADPIWRDSNGRPRHTPPPWPDDPESNGHPEPITQPRRGMALTVAERKRVDELEMELV